MKYLFTLLLLSFSLPSFQSNRQIFNDFHLAFEQSDFEKMDGLLTEDFSLLQDGKVSSNKTEYLKYMMNWNKAFNTKWNVVSVEEAGQQVKSIEYDSDIFNDHFYGDKMKFKYTYSFDKNKLKSIAVDTLPGTAKLRAIFDERFRKFYNWVYFNFPGKLQYLNQGDKQSALKEKELLEKYLLSLK
ncbi:nuclear transport factor 2 family protein [Ferruginibacter profundus]